MRVAVTDDECSNCEDISDNCQQHCQSVQDDQNITRMMTRPLYLHCKTTWSFVGVEDDQNGLDSARQACHQQHDGSVVVVQCFFVDVAALGCRVPVALNCAAGVYRQHTAVIHLHIRSALFLLFELLSYPEYCFRRRAAGSAVTLMTCRAI